MIYRFTVVACIAWAFLAISQCTPAHAGDSISYEATPGGEQLGIVTYHNGTVDHHAKDDGGEQFSFFEKRFIHRLQTQQGELVVEVITTLNFPCGTWDECPDRLSVLEAPLGTILVPGAIDLPEGATTTLRLMPFVGL